eukprot:5181041-Prymnesium_polylepis.1
MERRVVAQQRRHGAQRVQHRERDAKLLRRIRQVECARLARDPCLGQQPAAAPPECLLSALGEGRHQQCRMLLRQRQRRGARHGDGHVEAVQCRARERRAGGGSGGAECGVDEHEDVWRGLAGAIGEWLSAVERAERRGGIAAAACARRAREEVRERS